MNMAEEEKKDGVQEFLGVLGTIATVGGALWSAFSKKK